MGERKKYSVSDSRIPAFTSIFRKEVEAFGGVTRFSELTGISRPTISFWYNGERTPDAENMIKLAGFLNVNVDYLLGLNKIRDRNTTVQNVNAKLAQRLRNLITNTGELAKYLGCSIQAVNQYKQGTAYPKVENLIKIADFYNISVDYLFGITDVSNRDTSIQAVCEYTGLSEKSIRLLHIMAERGYSDKIKQLDYIIAYDEFYLAGV